jgi:hypothetical protein
MPDTPKIVSKMADFKVPASDDDEMLLASLYSSLSPMPLVETTTCCY